MQIQEAALVSERPLARSAPALCGLALVGLAAFWLQSRTFINHDVAWVIWGTREMLRGATFGRDIIEPNPPLAWYLSMPPVWLAERLGFSLSGAFRIWVALLAVLSLASCHALARTRLRGFTVEQTWLLTLLLAAYLLVFCYRDFGQREHLALILVLPYLFLAAARLQGAEIDRLAALGVGVCAGLGLALKPHFLAVPLLVELLGIVRSRRLGFVFRAETVGIAAAIGLYAILVLMFARAYLVEVIPLAREIYWSFANPLEVLIVRNALPLAALAFIGAAAARHDRSGLPTVLVAAALGFVVSYLVQAKGYTYHAYPFIAAGALAAAALRFQLGSSARMAPALAASAGLILLVGTSVLRTSYWWQEHQPGGREAELTRALIETVEGEAAGARFLAISTHPFPGFPIALEANVEWASRTNSQWFLPAVSDLREGRRSADAAMLSFAEEHARAFVMHDLAQRPDVVLIDARPVRHAIGTSRFDFLSFYLEDPAFGSAWRAYSERPPVGSFRVFARDEGDGR